MAISIPAFPEDRGPVKVDPLTGSTLSKEVSYCKDLKGCGTKDYTVLQQSMNLNVCDPAGTCTRTFVGSISVGIILKGDSTAADVDTLMDYIKANLNAAFKTCPPAA